MRRYYVIVVQEFSELDFETPTNCCQDILHNIYPAACFISSDEAISIYRAT